MKNLFYYETEIGSIGIAEKGHAITDIFFAGVDAPDDVTQMVEKETSLTKEAARQIIEYLKGERKAFELPLEAEGTAFQKAAWEALLSIPYGETTSRWQSRLAMRKPAERLEWLIIATPLPLSYHAIGLSVRTGN